MLGIFACHGVELLCSRSRTCPAVALCEGGSKGFMVNINADEHPGVHRYSLELAKYPELTESQYNSVISDLKQPGGAYCIKTPVKC